MTNNELIKFVIVKIGHQEFGISVNNIIDIIVPQKAFYVPLSRKEVIGSINLRGKIVTVLDIRLLLDIDESPANNSKCLISEHNDELFGFIVDEVGEVNAASQDDLVKNPNNFSQLWQEVSMGIYSKENELIVVLDINKVIDYVVKKAN